MLAPDWKMLETQDLELLLNSGGVPVKADQDKIRKEITQRKGRK